MTRSRAIGLLLGVAVLAATLVYAGAGPVVRTLASLRLSGLVLIALLHLPDVVAMALAWRLVGGDLGGASRLRFVWARLVRDAAAETLPFSQVGSFVFGIRALHLRGAEMARGALSMSADLIVELTAKLPYLLAGLLVLLIVAPGSSLLRPLVGVLSLTAAVVIILVLARRRIGRSLESIAGAILRRVMGARYQVTTDLRGDLERMLETILARRARLLAGFAIHLGCWLYGAAELWVVFALLGERIGGWQALAIDSAVSGLRTVAFMIPAAAGVQEASYVLAGAVFGIPPTAAVAASLARRARDLALGGLTLALASGSEFRSGSGQREQRTGPDRGPRGGSALRLRAVQARIRGVFSRSRSEGRAAPPRSG